MCPSRNATTTPRQRIAIRREMARQSEGSPVYEALMADFEYEAIQTCAADGTCQDACPVAIDTGALMKEFRRRERTEREEAVGLALAKHYALVERAARAGITGARAAGALPGDLPARGPADAVRARVSRDLVPSLPDSLPPGGAGEPPGHRASRRRRPSTCRRASTASSATPPADRPGPSLPEALVAVSARAGMPLWIPDDVAGHCCSTPVELEGLPPRPGPHGRATPRRRCGAGATAGACPS